MVWSRWRQGAASPPPPSPPPPFLFSIHPAPPVCASFACIVFEQCAVWTVRSWGNRRASSPPRLLSPASPSDAIKAYVSLKKGDAANRRQTSATSNMVPSHAHSISTERTDKARPKVCLTVYMYLRGVKSLIRTIPNTSTSFPHLERASLLVHTASKSIILKIPSCDASIKQWIYSRLEVKEAKRAETNQKKNWYGENKMHFSLFFFFFFCYLGLYMGDKLTVVCTHF